MSTPQLILTLSPQGGLIAELPGANGSRRQVKLEGSGEDITTSLFRMLQAQLRSQVAIGLDGAPTNAQVRHWQRHQGLWGDPSCPFCVAEGRFGAPIQRRTKPRETRAGDGSVRVRTIKSNKVLVQTDESVFPVAMTRKEARKLGWKPAPQTSSADLTSTGL